MAVTDIKSLTYGGDTFNLRDSTKQSKITASGILKGDGAGGVTAATAGTDYQAPLTAGTDYATPAQVGAKYTKPAAGIPKTDMASDVQTSLGKADTALQQHQSLAAYRTAAAQDEIDVGLLPIVNNAGAHNGIYRGKYLGLEVTAAQYAAIDAGTFDDLYIGDYWTINGVNWRIAAFDYWLHCGDTECTTHHVVIVPDTNLYTAKMYADNVVTGAYVGSQMYTTNLALAKTTINNTFGTAHILNHREYLQNAAVNNYSAGGAWYDSTIDLMNEQMVYGCRIFGNVLNDSNFPHIYTISKSQLPLFALEPSRICNCVFWWLRDVASSTKFAFVNFTGITHSGDSSESYGVRPAFGIKA